MNKDRFFTYMIAELASMSTASTSHILGIEVTDPKLAAMCGLGNIDPQHGPGAVGHVPAAIEVCADWPIPPVGACLATVRPDADSIGAMALLELRAAGHEPGIDMRARIAGIAAADRFDSGPWPGPRKLPDIREPASGDQPIDAVLGACASDRTVPLFDRVGSFMRYLSQGEMPERYRARAAEDRQRLMRSLAAGATRVTPVPGGQIAVVISLEPGALHLGYHLAPIVVALNPAWVFPSSAIGRKYTVARWHEDDADLARFGSRVAALEPGWGGQPGIKGSPQDRPSALTVEQIVGLLDLEEVHARVA